MAQLDTTQAHWLDVSDGDTLTAAEINARKDDIVAVLNGGIDTDNINTGTLEGANGGNGGFAELAKSTEQVFTGDLDFQGKITVSSELVLTETVEDATDLTPSVSGVNFLRINNATSGTVTIARFDDPEEGQILTVLLMGAGTSDDLVLDSITDTGANLTTDGQIFLISGTDFTFDQSAHEAATAVFIATDLGGTLSNLCWFPISAPLAILT